MNGISKEDLAKIAALIGAIASILGSLKALISVDPLFGWIALAFVVTGLFWYLAQGQRSIWIIGLLAVLALVSFGAAWWAGPVTVEIATYIDENRNGMCEAFEQTGPAGIEVQLLDCEGVMRVAYTDSGGVATFHGVPQGHYGILKVGPGIGGIASRVSRTAPVAISPTPQPPTDTPTPTPTATPTDTPTATYTPTATPTNTPTPTPTPVPNAITVASVNLRSGPGTVYDILSTLSPGQVLTVTGRVADATWLRVNTDQMQEGWVVNWADLVTLNLPIGQIPIVSPPPPPTETPTPTPAVAPPPAPPPPPIETPTLTPTPAVAPPPAPPPPPTETPTPTPTATPTPTPTCLITEPRDGDDDLGYENEVIFTCFDVPDSLYIWVLVYSHHDRNYYPQPGPIRRSEGQCKGMAYLGWPTEGIGHEFDIIIALADEAANAILQSAAANHSGWPDLPGGVEEKDSITVIRGAD